MTFKYICERKSVMDSDGLAGSIIILALVLIKAFFTVSETAVTEISDSKIKNFENGTKSQRRLYSLLQNPTRLITAFSVNRISTAILISYTAAVVYLMPLGDFFAGLTETNGQDEKLENLAYIAALFVIMLATILVLTVFCDGLPKRIAANGNTEKLASASAAPVSFLVTFYTPLIALSNALIKLFAALFGSKTAVDDAVTEEEILMMVDAGNETGVIEESQKEMINNVFEFNDLTASDIMTHRTDIVGVELGAGVSEVVNAAISSGFSRIPVYENNMDHIVGIICVKDLLCMVGSEAAYSACAKDFIREIIYVPDTIPCGELFRQLSEKKMQMAVVADEYGGTAGIVTMEDLVESIVGNIQDEYDNETEEIIKISDDTYTIDGTADPEHILGHFGIKLPEDNDYYTMSGFIINLLGRIPEENETPAVEYENVLFTVLIIEDMCITKLKATVLDKSNNENENNTKEKIEEHEEHEEKN